MRAVDLGSEGSRYSHQPSLETECLHCSIKNLAGGLITHANTHCGHGGLMNEE